MKPTAKLLAIVFLLSFSTGYSQSGLEKANKQYDKLAYVDAIKTYERVAEKGYKSIEIFEKLGNSYYFNADFVNAVKWYNQLFTMTGNIAPEYYYRYAQSLKAVGDYKKSDEYMQKFASKSSDVRSQLFKKNPNYLQKIKANSGRFIIENAGINSPYSDYGTAILGDELIFTSARDTGGIIRRKHSWTNESFTNLYVANYKNDSLGKVTKFDRQISSKFHESTPVFTKGGDTMYFTRNNYINGKKGKNADKVVLLQIYKSHLLQAGSKKARWSEPETLSINSNHYSTAHPALREDGTKMYFASDMPGTIGQSDIFIVDIHADGTFGTPQNLGPNVNTEGRESFPFATNNELYFASDGRPGLGGLDIYVTTISNGLFSAPENIGAPANSQKDDFAFMINQQTRKGFLSSNRDGGIGNDDIYKFTETKKLGCDQVLSGIVTDRISKAILPNTKLTISRSDFTPISTVISDNKGKYNFTVKCGDSYYVKAEKPDYTTEETSILIPEDSGETNLNISLDRSIQTVSVGDDLAITLKLNPIYFDLDKSDIRPDAELELQRVLAVLNQNINITIDIRSHTDSRQTKQYNQALSDARAKSTQNYLINNGITASRLTYKGYGETKLVNKCSDGVDCTEDEHQLNRRSEFIISSVDGRK